MTHFRDLTVQEVEGFRSAIKEVLDQHSINDFYLGRIVLAISFDKDCYPFIGKSRGYNFEDGVRSLDRIVNLPGSITTPIFTLAPERGSPHRRTSPSFITHSRPQVPELDRSVPIRHPVLSKNIVRISMPLGDAAHLGVIERHQVAVLDHRTTIRDD